MQTLDNLTKPFKGEVIFEAKVQTTDVYNNASWGGGCLGILVAMVLLFYFFSETDMEPYSLPAMLIMMAIILVPAIGGIGLVVAMNPHYDVRLVKIGDNLFEFRLDTKPPYLLQGPFIFETYAQDYVKNSTHLYLLIKSKHDHIVLRETIGALHKIPPGFYRLGPNHIPKDATIYTKVFGRLHLGRLASKLESLNIRRL